MHTFVNPVGRFRRVAIDAPKSPNDVAIVTIHVRGRWLVQWRVSDKRLRDFARSIDSHSIAETVALIYQCVSPARKAWLTRWLTDFSW